MSVAYVCTARSVSNVNVLPLLTWNTYNFMMKLPDFFALAYLAHLVIQGHPAEKHKHEHEIVDNLSLVHLRSLLYYNYKTQISTGAPLRASWLTVLLGGMPVARPPERRDLHRAQRQLYNYFIWLLEFIEGRENIQKEYYLCWYVISSTWIECYASC